MQELLPPPEVPGPSAGPDAGAGPNSSAEAAAAEAAAAALLDDQADKASSSSTSGNSWLPAVTPDIGRLQQKLMEQLATLGIDEGGIGGTGVVDPAAGGAGDGGHLITAGGFSSSSSSSSMSTSSTGSLSSSGGGVAQIVQRFYSSVSNSPLSTWAHGLPNLVLQG